VHEGQPQVTIKRNVPRGCFARFGVRSELVGCGVRLGRLKWLPPRSAVRVQAECQCNQSRGSVFLFRHTRDFWWDHNALTLTISRLVTVPATLGRRSIPPAGSSESPELSGKVNSRDRGVVDSSLSSGRVPSCGHLRSRAHLTCPHTVTVLAQCVSWGTEDLHSGDFHPLRRAQLRHSNCKSEYRPEYARQRTRINMSWKET
jgi:hypothetical protein